MRILKEIRNDIAHKYIQEGLQQRFADALENTAMVLDIVKKTMA